MKLLKYLYETMILPKYLFLSKIKLPVTSTSFCKEIILLKCPSSSDNNIIWNFVFIMQWDYEDFCFYQTIRFFARLAARNYLMLAPNSWSQSLGRSHELIKKLSTMKAELMKWITFYLHWRTPCYLRLTRRIEQRFQQNVVILYAVILLAVKW